MFSRSKTEFVAYDESFLNLSWEWLNDSEIKQMTLTPDMTREGQRKWFENLNSRNDYHIWGIVYRVQEHKKKLRFV